MLTVISPAKKLDFDLARQPMIGTEPALLSDTSLLMQKAQTLTKAGIKKLMGLSDDLIALNLQRYSELRPETNASVDREAMFAFRGDTYLGLDADTLAKADVAYAQDHLRIISGLYGLLRPCDLIQPYRLEMSIRLKTRRGSDLYNFWGNRIAKLVNEALAEDQNPVLLNLASNEYFKAVDRKTLKARVVTPVFKEIKDGKSMTMGFIAKRSRGQMARFIIENRIDNPEDLKSFAVEGYAFDAKASSEDRLQFSRVFVSRAAA